MRSVAWCLLGMGAIGGFDASAASTGSLSHCPAAASVLSARLHRNVFAEVNSFSSANATGVCYFSNRAKEPQRLYRVGFRQQLGGPPDIASIEATSRMLGAVAYPQPAFGRGAFVTHERFTQQWETILTFSGSSVTLDGRTQNTYWQVWVQLGLRVRRSFYLSLRVVKGAAAFVRR